MELRRRAAGERGGHTVRRQRSDAVPVQRELYEAGRHRSRVGLRALRGAPQPGRRRQPALPRGDEPQPHPRQPQRAARRERQRGRGCERHPRRHAVRSIARAPRRQRQLDQNGDSRRAGGEPGRQLVGDPRLQHDLARGRERRRRAGRQRRAQAAQHLRRHVRFRRHRVLRAAYRRLRCGSERRQLHPGVGRAGAAADQRERPEL